MMTFPGLSHEKRKSFEDIRKAVTQSFLTSPDVSEWIKDEKELAELNDLLGIYNETVEKEDIMALKKLEEKPLFSIIRAVFFLEKGEFSTYEIASSHLNAGARYIKYRSDMLDTYNREQQAALKGTVAGWIGVHLETITRPLGFDYRTNIALLGGFAAKEVVVSTLGTAYSLGDVDTEKPESLSARLRNEPSWNPLLAFTLIIFTMLYVPCFVTVVMIRRESSWGWAGFSIGFNVFVAYLVAFVIRQVGTAFGLGV
jgi:ferrous iron transport protein B